MLFRANRSLRSPGARLSAEPKGYRATWILGPHLIRPFFNVSYPVLRRQEVTGDHYDM
jgi:hypothetical protein